MDALPPQVRAAAEEADRIQAQLYPPAEAPPTPPTAQQEVPQAPATPPAATGTTEPPRPADEASWEHRYRTLQGMMTAQKQRHEDERKGMEQQLRDALARISSLETATRKPETQTPAQPAVTDKDTEAFGPELIDLAKRIAQDTVQHSMAKVETALAAKDAEIAKLREQLGGVSEQTKVVSQHTYLGELTKLVPDWEAVNTSQSWLEWLGQTDPLSGQPRQTYLDDAFVRHDVARTAQIFNAFKAAKGSQPPQPTAASSELQRQVQPTSSQAASVTPSASDAASRIWTAAEIGEHYNARTRGAYRGREAEAARIEAEIDAALATGRVR